MSAVLKLIITCLTYVCTHTSTCLPNILLSNLSWASGTDGRMFFSFVMKCHSLLLASVFAMTFVSPSEDCGRSGSYKNIRFSSGKSSRMGPLSARGASARAFFRKDFFLMPSHWVRVIACNRSDHCTVAIALLHSHACREVNRKLRGVINFTFLLSRSTAKTTVCRSDRSGSLLQK